MIDREDIVVLADASRASSRPSASSLFGSYAEEIVARDVLDAPLSHRAIFLLQAINARPVFLSRLRRKM